MRRLERPSGNFVTFDPRTFARVEGETRMCVHCNYMWIYNPMKSFDNKLIGLKPAVRGKCLKCYGMVCARPECLKTGCIPLLKQVEMMEQAGKKQSGILLKGN